MWLRVLGSGEGRQTQAVASTPDRSLESLFAESLLSPESATLETVDGGRLRRGRRLVGGKDDDLICLGDVDTNLGMDSCPRVFFRFTF